jgi:nucleotide-binding universal stress UspA family protein
MKKILTCTDGSIYAQSTYDHTAWAANRTDAAVHILHMLEAHRERAETSDLSGNIGFDSGETLLKELVAFEESKNRLARENGTLILAEAERYLTEAGLTRITIEQLHGELVEEVVKQEAEADLVVIGKRGESADFAKLHLGSNLERVVRASIRPVLVASRQFVPIEKFLFAYDGSPSAEKALKCLLYEPLLKEAECHILRSGKIDADAEWLLNEAAAKLAGCGYQVKIHSIAGSVEGVISDTIQKENIQMLVMGAYGHSRIRQLIIGSTTTTMVRTCQVSVLMFH